MTGTMRGGGLDRARGRVRYLWLAVLLVIPATARAQPFAYVANYGTNNVSVIDVATNTVVAAVSVGSNPESVAITPDGIFAYVTNASTDRTVMAIDIPTNTVVATIGVGLNPFALAVKPDNS